MNKTLSNLSLFLLLMLVPTVSFSGKVEKGFEALSVFNYFKAKQFFEKKLEKNKTACSYGLSVVYGRNDNPFYNLDSAYRFVLVAEASFLLEEEKQKGKLKELGVDSIAIQDWKDSIDAKVYKTLTSKTNPSQFQGYLDVYTDSDYRNLAERARDSLMFQQVKQFNNSEDFKVFLDNYPASHLSNTAEEEYNRALFSELLVKDDLLSYQDFLKKHPGHPQNKAVEDSIYLKSTPNQSIVEFEKFIAKNPKNNNAGKAWRNIYKLYTSNYSTQIIKDFQIEYPNYPFEEELNQDFQLSQERFLPFRSNEKWGFMSAEGVIKIKPTFDFVEEFSEGLALVSKNDNIGFIDKQGETVIPLVYEEASPFQNGVAIVSNNQQFGLINRANNLIVPMKFEVIEPFYLGIALVAAEEGYAFIDQEGNVMSEMYFDYATDFANGFAIVSKNGKKGMLNPSMAFQIPMVYNQLSITSDTLLVAKNDSVFGLIDFNNDTITPFVYDRIDDFSGELALVQKGTKYGYLNNKGELQIPIKYEYTLSASIWGKFQNQVAKFQKSGKFGVIDEKGKELSPAIFENLKDYSITQIYPVKKKGLWGFANSKLQLKISYQFQTVGSFSTNELAVAENDTAVGLINTNGEWFWEPSFSSILQVSDSLYMVSKQKSGLFHLNGKEILSLQFDKIELKSKELLQLTQGGSVFYFDMEKGEMIEPEQ